MNKQPDDDGSQDEDPDYVQSENNYHTLQSSESDSNYEESEFHMPDQGGPSISVNMETPDMTKGAKYENIYQFRLALRQYNIINESKVKYIKSEPKCVTVRCADMNCKWRLHASRLVDGVTFQVKVTSEPHTCSYVNKCGNESASKYWIASKVKCNIQVF